MDEESKKVFKRKFIILTVMLNVIVLCAAMGVFIFIRFSSTTAGMAIGGVLVAVAVLTALVFSRKYRETKSWLYQQA
ncbi:MAG: hypothetical protein KO206_05600 [Methanomicrobiaceae archaeon]|uniref:Uncharacterized protein n=1 Tax=hydrocarbon metagenome TaxID=938273 RepID=A0A0W8FJU7_9ZZZZ|nr:hypothetical protein [Methanomicrobiaceae archaeon]MDD5419237.1 hypothetical protein [Methanomicrobiaceae archaeon]